MLFFATRVVSRSVDRLKEIRHKITGTETASYLIGSPRQAPTYMRKAKKMLGKNRLKVETDSLIDHHMGPARAKIGIFHTVLTANRANEAAID
jgi:hypothetical protein